MEKLIEQYNSLKKRAGYPVDEFVTECCEHSELKACTRDKYIDKVIDMLYFQDLNLEEISERHSESFVTQYKKVLELQNDFIHDVSNITADKYFNLARGLHKANNYRILNAYFNGVIIGLKIIEELKQE